MSSKVLITKTKNLKMFILLGDHGSAHVHVFGPGAEAKVYADGTVEHANGFNQFALNRISKWVKENATQIQIEWDKVYGKK